MENRKGEKRVKRKTSLAGVLAGIMLAVLLAAGCARQTETSGIKAEQTETAGIKAHPAETAGIKAEQTETAGIKAEQTETAEIKARPVEMVTAGNGVSAAKSVGRENGGSQREPSGFVLLADAVPDVIQEIRYYSTYNFVGERIDGYEEPCAILTKEAASALKEVSDEVKAMGYRLKVYDAYRPQAAVDHFARWAEDEGDTRMKAYFYPEVDKSRLFDQGYIGRKSGHSRGSTVDLTLFDMKTGKEVDMGGTFDYFGQRSHPDYQGDLTAEQAGNRKRLRKVMMDHGFRPLSTEWWHFTLEGEPYPNTYFTFPVSSSLGMAE